MSETALYHSKMTLVTLTVTIAESCSGAIANGTDATLTILQTALTTLLSCFQFLTAEMKSKPRTTSIHLLAAMRARLRIIIRARAAREVLRTRYAICCRPCANLVCAMLRSTRGTYRAPVPRRKRSIVLITNHTHGIVRGTHRGRAV